MVRNPLPTSFRSGIDITVIALKRHEDPASTQAYLHADMTIKEQALARVQPRGTQPGRYRAPDSLLTFLDTLSPPPARPGLCRARSPHQRPDQHLHIPVGIIPESA
jgi:hypothetical protein